MHEKRYLGDGVYIQYDGEHVVLTTSNGVDTTNEIYLDQTVLLMFELYIKQLQAKENEAFTRSLSDFVNKSPPVDHL